MSAEVSSMPNGSYVPQHGFDQQQANNAYASQNYNQAPAASSNSASTATPQPEIPKDEVGWYFVEQYYTTLSRTPEKLYVSWESIGIRDRAMADGWKNSSTTTSAPNSCQETRPKRSTSALARG
jgi:hypothetical protein